MTIDGVNISTFGMMLSYITGHLDQPARKKTMEVPGFEEKDIVFEAKEPVIILIGFYTSKAALLAEIQAFQSLIRSNTVHEFGLSGHNVTFSGAVMDGMRVDTIKNSVTITFKVTIIEL